MKKTTVFLLIFVLVTGILTPAFSARGCESYDVGEDTAFLSENPFAAFDARRDSLLSGKKTTSPLPAPRSESPAAERYIVRFRASASLAEVYEAVCETEYSLLAYSSERMFVVTPDNPGQFLSDYGDIIEYAVSDSVTASFAETEGAEAETPWELEALGADETLIYGGEGVIVAVLDSGIDRENPLLAGANIHEGWNAVTGMQGVYGDAGGHGTKISAIIASPISGIARGAALLPVLITGERKTILTSYLVSGIYYAADYGADVINMSFGGYAENLAERDAVDYAFGKGCILIAAAGNEGRDVGYAGAYSYPASYETVISVAAVGRNGSSTVFSQYNDKVDTAAPGDDLSVIPIGSDGFAESGTSFATAFISGVAALAAYNSPRALNTVSFRKLLEYAASEPRNDYVGYGVPKLDRLLDCLPRPCVTGISDGGVYFEEVAAVFSDNSSAYLDGEEYLSGESVFSQGNHVLTVSDEFGNVTLGFTVDTLKLNYTPERSEDGIAVTFRRGTATVDGRPYVSGEKITGFGSHSFVLTGPYGNTVSETFLLSADLPSVFGAEDGAIYTNRIMITVIGDGSSFLDGIEFFGTAFVSENGTHTLVCTDYAGTRSETMSFTLETVADDARPAFGSRVCPGEGFGWTAFWTDGTDGIKIVADNEPSTLRRYLQTPGEVFSFRLYPESKTAIAVCADGYATFDANLILSESDPISAMKVNEYASVAGESAAGVACFADASGQIIAVNLFDGTETLLNAYTGGVLLSSDGVTAYAYSPYTPSELYAFSSGEWSSRTLGDIPEGYGLYVGGGAVFIGDTCYDAGTLERRYRLAPKSKVMYCGDGICVDEAYLRSALTGEILGKYGSRVTGATLRGDGSLCIVNDGMELETATAENRYCAAEAKPVLTGNALDVRPFNYGVPLVSDAAVRDTVYDSASDRILVIRENDNRLYYLDSMTGALTDSVCLKYTPSSLCASDEGAAVLFAGEKTVYLTATDTYAVFPGRVSSVCFGDGELFAVCNGTVCRYVISTGITDNPLGMITADAVAARDGRLYVVTVYDITCFELGSFIQLAMCETIFRSRLFVTDNRLVAGDGIYDSRTLEYVATLSGTVYACSGNAAFTSDGLYSLEDGRLVSDYAPATVCAAFTDDHTAFIFGDSAISVIDSQGFDPTLPAVITGVSDKGVYAEEVTVAFDRGTAFNDSRRITSGYRETTAGTHILTAVTAWDVSVSLTFTVVYSATALSTAQDGVKLNVGEKTDLTINVFPEGAAAEIIFTAESDNVSVNGGGTVTALAQGEGVIRVSVVGRPDVFCICRIYVTDALTVCLNPEYKIDRTASIVYNIPTGIALTELLASFEAYESTYSVITADGTTLSEGTVMTGMKLMKSDLSGNETDRLSISLRGDLDGDGFVTVNDGDILYGSLLESGVLPPTVFRAADVNLNGRLTLNDFRLLRAELEYGVSAPDNGEQLYINIPVFGYAESEFYITVRNDNMPNATSLSGRISYDPAVLSIARVTTYGGEIYTDIADGTLTYSVFGIDDARALRVYFRIDSTASGKETSVAFTDTRSASDGVHSLPDVNEVFKVRTVSATELTVTASNADLTLVEGVYDYDVTIPYNESVLSIDFDCPTDCFVYFNSYPVPEGGTRTVQMSYLRDGEIVEYRFRVTRESRDDTKKDGDSRLSSLAVNGATASTPFDPAKTLYIAHGIYGSEISVSGTPMSEEATVSVKSPTVLMPGSNIFTLKCVAEDGTATVYTVNVVLEKQEEPSEVSDEASREPEPEVSQNEPSSHEESIHEDVSQSEADVSEATEAREIKNLAGIILVAFGAAALIVAVVMMCASARRKHGE